MRLLCIYPGMDPRYNDNFHALRHLRAHGVEIVVLARWGPGLKSTQPSPRFEVVDGVPIHRRWRDVAELNALSGRSLHDAEELADAAKPDVIWCSSTHNLPLGRHLARRHRVPLVLLSESLFDAQLLLGRRRRWWRPWLGVRARRLRAELLEAADVVITSDRGETGSMAALRGRALLRIVPWCNEVPEEILSGSAPVENRGIYIGSLHHFKNAQRLPWMAERLLRGTTVARLEIVGPGPYRRAIERLVARHPGRVSYTESLPRSEALARLRASRFAFTATRVGGWGLFGDAWAVGTPVVSLHDAYQLADGVDACLVPRGGDPGLAARRLWESPAYREAIRAGGRARYLRDHTAEAVGGAWLAILRELLQTDAASG